MNSFSKKISKKHTKTFTGEARSSKSCGQIVGLKDSSDLWFLEVYMKSCFRRAYDFIINGTMRRRFTSGDKL